MALDFRIQQSSKCEAGPGWGQQWPSKAAVPTTGTSAKSGQTGGRVWHGRDAMVMEQALSKVGMLNEAIVWPK